MELLGSVTWNANNNSNNNNKSLRTEQESNWITSVSASFFEKLLHVYPARQMRYAWIS